MDDEARAPNAASASVVFLSGKGADPQSWRHQVAELPAGFEAIVPGAGYEWNIQLPAEFSRPLNRFLVRYPSH